MRPQNHPVRQTDVVDRLIKAAVSDSLLMREAAHEIRNLREAIETLRKYADDTWSMWNTDQDHKVGKRLMAMAGRLPNYDEGVTKALSKVKE